MQANKAVEKFSKKKVYDPVGDEVRKRKKQDNRTGKSKFRNRFMELESPAADNVNLY